MGKSSLRVNYKIDCFQNNGISILKLHKSVQKLT